MSLLNSEDRQAIHDLIATYNITFDIGDAGRWAATFTEDGTFENPGGTVTGRAALADYARLRVDARTDADLERVQHWAGNIVLAGDSAAGVAQAFSYVHRIAWRADGSREVLDVLYCRDALVRVDRQWRFRARRVAPWPPAANEIGSLLDHRRTPVE